MSKIVFVFKQGQQTLKEFSVSKIYISKSEIQGKILSSTSLKPEEYQIGYLDDENQLITVSTQEDYEIARQQSIDSSLTFIITVSSSKDVVLCQAHLQAQIFDKKELNLQPELSIKNKTISMGSIGVMQSLKTMLPQIHKKQEKRSNNKQKSKKKSKNHQKQQKENPVKQQMNDILQDLECDLSIDSDEFSYLHSNPNQINKIKNQKFKRQIRMTHQKQLIKKNIIGEIKEWIIQNIKDECFKKELQPKIYKRVEKQKICSSCECPITIPFYMNNQNQCYCQDCEQNLGDDGLLVKIKSQQHLKQLFIVKTITILHQDIKIIDQKLYQNSKQKQWQLLKFSENFAVTKLHQIFEEQRKKEKMNLIVTEVENIQNKEKNQKRKYLKMEEMKKTKKDISRQRALQKLQKYG